MPNSQFQSFETRNNSTPEEFEILKTAPTKDYRNILFLCSNILDLPVTVLLVSNGEGFSIKTAHGLAPQEIEYDSNLLREVLNKEELYLDDAQKICSGPEDFSFSAALPLLTREGHRLGLILALGKESRKMSADKKRSLEILGEQVLYLVEYRKQNNKILRVQRQLEQKYAELEKFASVVSHDLKSPLANIISLTELLKEENQENMNQEAREYIDFLSQASHNLRSYIDGILGFYRSERILEKAEEDVVLQKFFEGIVKLYAVKPDVEISYPRNGTLKKVNKAALTQIFMNLISNALKYNNKPRRTVDIEFEATPSYYLFEVKDNGNGISEENFARIFDLFTTLEENDREGYPGSGIGLATVKKLLDHMNAEIEIESELGKGSNFMLKIRRSC